MPSSLPQSSGSLLVIIGIICLTIGYVFGWLISMLRPKEAKGKSEDETVKSSEQESVETRASVLKLWREPDQGKLLVEFDGKVFDKSVSLTPDQHKRLEGALRETAGWLGLINQATPAGGAAPRSASAAPALPITPQRPPSVIGGMTGAIADAIQPVTKKDETKSIVGQIDEIVQHMLTSTPYANENIFLAEDPKRGVLVRVGNQVYEGIGSVPEGEIKNLLKAAVAEWEKQQELLRRRVI
jgi:hypothetical protein